MRSEANIQALRPGLSAAVDATPVLRTYSSPLVDLHSHLPQTSPLVPLPFRADSPREFGERRYQKVRTGLVISAQERSTLL